MNLSDFNEYALSYCWEGKEPRSTNIIIGNTYTFNGKKHKVSESDYEELLEYINYTDRPYTIRKSGKIINLVGLKVVN